MPVYNNEYFIEKCLNSIRCQTYPNLEIICIDQGSTDNSLNILNAYKQADSRITVISQDYTGEGIAFNTGLNSASGDYITFVNPNDWLLLTLYQTFVNYINNANSDTDIFMFNTGVYNSEINDVVQQTCINIRDWNAHFSDEAIHTFNDCQNPFINTLEIYNKIFRRQFLFDNKIKFVEFLHFGDMYFAFKSLLSASKILVCDRVLARERFAKKPMTEKVFDIFKILDLFEGEISKHKVYESFKYAFFQFKYNACIEHYAGCPEQNKESYYNTMKFWLLSSENPDLDKEILSHLRNYELFERIKQCTRQKFDKLVKL